ncbi:uncharacterized protein TTMY_0328 [Thermus thermophilus]|uniref:hypothetical protein n=1 Tax=Thermus thermophilus TaxID=274 RepID=UPI000909FC84|nr:hypothetical protein [Thermus thermophilus]BAW00741.1 uncharacterized protein TTMY_0328 [Thermus thermophilus]BDB11448.1 hypothetical protein TthTMY_11870 [Thermus thermophilus]
MDPAVRERLQAYRPVFELVGTVRLLLEMDGQRGFTLTKAQAQRLLPLLRRLQSLPDLKPVEAERILTEIEEKILTPAQLKWLDTRRLEVQRARQAPPEGQRPGNGQGQRGANPGGQGPGGFQALLRGEPFNPFRQGGAAEDLKALIARLEKR